MFHRIARTLLPLMLLLAAAPVAAHARLTVGVSDGSQTMFSQPNFLRLHIRTVRAVVPWNTAIMRNRRTLHAAQAWVRAAERAHATPMISFGGNGNYIPSVRLYTAAIKAFLHAVPSVHVYTPWNEPDWIYRRLSKEPRLAAAYFNTLVRWCHPCTIVAGDLYLPAAQLGPWIRAYERGLHSRPKAWALHPYDDVRTHTTTQIRTLYRLTSGQIWLDEISGVERRGHWAFRNQSPAAANRDERFLFSLPKRFHRITRIYHYEWQANRLAGWDSALLGPGGGRRPAYWTVANAAKGRLP